ncbi:hypothetical protein DICPUDRAFT_82858 [Dictyostelium purpureum]|uniref:Uncharacterized protein n=1 Tax=Dictyostelium purpureum TaxID=5786 RepID=F0ZXU7_DICPU|nr:uncharacterized protein DICPUDRAFT_82858 [Dictyostelium purpureum]EGC31235.1 hypothetical protein DICPUDRAFT_82858 [Dictyostelium purpureum]|eukprot:XP_003292238.1 hypothetical protein DICPUDRAFT_82858 [Dictyostelium purpureum]
MYKIFTIFLYVFFLISEISCQQILYISKNGNDNIAMCGFEQNGACLSVHGAIESYQKNVVSGLNINTNLTTLPQLILDISSGTYQENNTVLNIFGYNLTLQANETNGPVVFQQNQTFFEINPPIICPWTNPSLNKYANLATSSVTFSGIQFILYDNQNTTAPLPLLLNNVEYSTCSDFNTPNVESLTQIEIFNCTFTGNQSTALINSDYYGVMSNGYSEMIFKFGGLVNLDIQIISSSFVNISVSAIDSALISTINSHSPYNLLIDDCLFETIDLSYPSTLINNTLPLTFIGTPKNSVTLSNSLFHYFSSMWPVIFFNGSSDVLFDNIEFNTYSIGSSPVFKFLGYTNLFVDSSNFSTNFPIGEGSSSSSTSMFSLDSVMATFVGTYLNVNNGNPFDQHLTKDTFNISSLIYQEDSSLVIRESFLNTVVSNFITSSGGSIFIFGTQYQGLDMDEYTFYNNPQISIKCTPSNPTVLNGPGTNPSSYHPESCSVPSLKNQIGWYFLAAAIGIIIAVFIMIVLFFSCRHKLSYRQIN